MPQMIAICERQLIFVAETHEVEIVPARAVRSSLPEAPAGLTPNETRGDADIDRARETKARQEYDSAQEQP